MRTEVISIYQFEELSPEAKETARQWCRNLEDYEPYTSEAWNSLQKFSELTGIDAQSLDFCNGDIRYSTGNIDDRVLNLSGARLLSYVWNNYGAAWKGKYYSKTRATSTPNKYQYVCRYSKIAISPDNCPFTGIVYDDILLKPFADLWKINGLKTLNNTTLMDFLTDCISNLEKAIRNEYGYMQTAEYIDDLINANGYEFNENGSRY